MDRSVGPSNAAPTSTPGRQRQKTAEVWDEDFEFPTAAVAKGKGKEVDSRSSGLKGAKTEVDDEESPVEDWDADDWDGSPPAAAPARLPSPSTGKRKSPEVLNLAGLSLGSPRASSSHSTDLPIPRSPTTSSSGSALQLVSHAESSTSSSKQRTRSGSMGRNKLIKRHPSMSFVPLASSSDTLAHAVPPVPASQSSYDVSRIDTAQHKPISRSKSGEQMPPPPLPSQAGHAHSRTHSRTRTSSRPGSRQGEIRVSAIPLSPSQDHNVIMENQKKPSFWKRLSGQPLMGEPKTGPGTYIQDSIKVHRRRSSSNAMKKDSELPISAYPPVPPIPPNLRSPSATSNMSSSSAASSSSNRSGPMAAISLMRRSASNLSRKSQQSTPPSSYPHPDAAGSSTSISNAPRKTPPSIQAEPAFGDPRSPQAGSWHAFSPGFHLPSPSPRSPYRPAVDTAFAQPPMPHSASFPLKLDIQDSDTDTETDEVNRTPRRKKIRPVSLQPSAPPARGWNGGEGWRGFSDKGPSTSSRPPDPLPIAQRSASSGTSRVSSPRTATFASSTANTLRRLGSMSKKHGRRLSGGFRFNQADPRTPTTLEPVAGSPSKSSALDGRDEDAIVEDDHQRGKRGESVSAPSSTIRDLPSGMTPSISSSTIKGTLKGDKHRRRQSWNDFIIPSSVLAKQKDLKKNLSAVKQFAAGLDTLRALLDTHAEAQKNVLASSRHDKLEVYQNLEAEFAQWWEMAVVLIEVGNTGVTGTGSNRTSSDTADRRTSPRSRRITLASDEARAMGDALRSASDNTPSNDLRKGSMPDPVDYVSGTVSPPRATPEQWRASTGRQELSKRQLEVLRTMLSTPVSDRGPSPSSVRANSSLSQTSIADKPTPTVVATATMRQISRSTNSDRSTSGVDFPSPAGSTYIVPSDSFPSPNTAATLANPKRASRAGLAGLKDYLRSMKGRPDTAPGSPSPANRPIPVFGPPRSPTAPTGHGYPHTAIEARFTDSPSPSPWPQPPPTAGLIGKQHKRPSIRNIFRASSGTWNDLVRNDRIPPTQSPPRPPLPRQPSRPELSARQSSLPSTTEDEEQTVRQVRKSRIIGLGWPDMDDPAALPGSSASSTPPRPMGPLRRSTTSDKADNTVIDPGPELTVALTPENLPVLLDYLRTCERMLGQWKERATGQELLEREHKGT